MEEQKSDMGTGIIKFFEQGFGPLRFTGFHNGHFGNTNSDQLKDV